MQFFDDWTIEKPGKITLYNKDDMWSQIYSQKYYAQSAAHEFGHILGLGDAYAAWYRNNKEAPNTIGDMMNDNTKVTDTDISMLLEAWKTGRPQYFPRQ